MWQGQPEAWELKSSKDRVMAWQSKRKKQFGGLFEKGKSYELKAAIGVLKKAPRTKFDETVELQFKLGIKADATDQTVRGTAVLPHGTGKNPKILVLCKDESAKEAKEAGAEYVGGDELVQKIQSGWLDFDVILAAPSMMREVGKLGKILGPRGLMPSPKAGTVTDNLVKAVKEIKLGRIEFKMDKLANLNAPIGKISFSEDALNENGSILIQALLRARPKSLKGDLIESAHLSCTMGPGVRLDLSGFSSEGDENE